MWAQCDCFVAELSNSSARIEELMYESANKKTKKMDAVHEKLFPSWKEKDLGARVLAKKVKISTLQVKNEDELRSASELGEIFEVLKK